MNSVGDSRIEALNSVLVSPRIAEWLYCSGQEFYWTPEQFIDILLAESATKIFISKWEAENIGLNLNDASDIAKQHVELIDKNYKVFSKTKSIIENIDLNLNWNKNKEEMLNFALNRVFEILYHLQLAVKFHIDCDISRPTHVLNEIELLKLYSNDKEIISFLSELIGVLNLYVSYDIQGNIIYKSVEGNIENRVKDLMLDATFLELSGTKRDLTTTGNIKLIPKIKMLARKISNKRSYRQFIRIIDCPIQLLPQPLGNVKETIGGILNIKDKFSPSIVDVDKIAWATLKRINPPPWDVSGSTVHIVTSLYDSLRDPIHRI